MSKFRAFFRYLSAFILGLAFACSVDSAVADLTRQVANYLATNTYLVGDSAGIRFPKDMYFYSQTSDGADTGTFNFAGGGNTASAGRGSGIIMRGNEAVSGALTLFSGSNGGNILLAPGLTTVGTVSSSGLALASGTQLDLSAATATLRLTVATGLTATGTALGDSLSLTSMFNRLTTVAVNTGANLHNSTGVLQCVQNLGANNLKLYPNGASGQINGAGAGNPITVASATRDIACCILLASNTYMCSVSPGPAA